ncbi:olfactory receptor 2M3-like protein [Labeo rohita]|uniref:Olfactory receptor 2M3-like protein n=1 Tax=Labeo rohita TaxID=84645 RepID=A0A498N2R4_LABRO|nr:olfactory receptor 2M3-like protein [Labeo rohita]
MAVIGTTKLESNGLRTPKLRTTGIGTTKLRGLGSPDLEALGPLGTGPLDSGPPDIETLNQKTLINLFMLMAGSNGTTGDVFFYYQQVVIVEIDAGLSTKTAVAVLTSLFFCFVNSMMFFTLRSKRIFYETPRYILFGHMLMNDSVLLLGTTILYTVGLSFLPMPSSICTLLVFVCYCTFRNAPLTLALMSLERLWRALMAQLRKCLSFISKSLK